MFILLVIFNYTPWYSKNCFIKTDWFVNETHQTSLIVGKSPPQVLHVSFFSMAVYLWRYTHNAHSEADSLAVVPCSAMLMKLSHSTFSPRIYILHSLQPSTAGVLLHSVLFCVIRLICIQSTVIRSRLNASRYARCSRSRLVLIFIDLIRI